MVRDPERLREYVAGLKLRSSEESAKHTQLGTGAFEGYLDVLAGHQEAGLARIRRMLSFSRRRNWMGCASQSQNWPGCLGVAMR